MRQPRPLPLYLVLCCARRRLAHPGSRTSSNSRFPQRDRTALTREDDAAELRLRSGRAMGSGTWPSPSQAPTAVRLTLSAEQPLTVEPASKTAPLYDMKTTPPYYGCEERAV